MRSRPAAIAALVIPFLAVVLSGCAAAPQGSAGGAVTVADAWVRPADAGQASAAYLAITNGTPAEETLVGASTPVAGSAAVHQTTTDANGMTGMHEASLVIPAGQTVQLDPGGYHLMLMDLTQTLTPGTTVPLTLTFEHAGPLQVQAEVRGG